MASSALALLLPRGVPALHRQATALRILAAVEPLSPPAAASAGDGAPASSAGRPKATPPLKALHGTPWKLHPDYRRWKDAQEEILRDIEPIRMLTKHILHSDRYFDGERLSAKDEKEVIGKLLRYHPLSEDKIGRGLDYINGTMAEKKRKFDITSFQSCLSDAVTKFISWHEISVAATVQYNEEKEQCLHNLHKQGKKLKKYQELKRDNERKLEEVEKEYKSILEEVQKGNQILLNLIQSSNATLRQNTYKGNENSTNTIFDIELEDEDHVASKKSVEISGPVRKKSKRN